MNAKPYFVLLGEVGSGKSTICEKLTGRTGLSSNSATSFTTDSKVFQVDRKYWIADTPGVMAARGRLNHALNILGAMKYRPLTAFVFVCSVRDRLDGLQKAVCELIGPFLESYGANTALIVTKQDSQNHIEEDVTLKAMNEDLKCPVLPGTVYRGLNGVQVSMAPNTQYVPGKYIIWVSFSSCSRKESVSTEFTHGYGPRTLFTINQNSGVDIAPISVFQPPWHNVEHETLLSPNIVLKVENVTSVGELDTITLTEVKNVDILDMMECADPASTSSDNTPWTTSLAFLQENEVKTDT